MVTQFTDAYGRHMQHIPPKLRNSETQLKHKSRVISFARDLVLRCPVSILYIDTAVFFVEFHSDWANEVNSMDERDFERQFKKSFGWGILQQLSCLNDLKYKAMILLSQIDNKCVRMCVDVLHNSTMIYWGLGRTHNALRYWSDIRRNYLVPSPYQVQLLDYGGSSVLDNRIVVIHTDVSLPRQLNNRKKKENTLHHCFSWQLNNRKLEYILLHACHCLKTEKLEYIHCCKLTKTITGQLDCAVFYVDMA